MFKSSNRRTFLAECSTAAGLAASSALFPHVAFGQGSSRVRVGQIGTAHSHAAGKMETFRKLSEHYEVVGVVESDPSLKAAAMKHKAYTGLAWVTEDELLNTSGLQCVAIETEIRDLIPAAQRCVEAGMHVHVDKPAGESLSALKTLHQTASNKMLCIQMGYMFRYNPAFAFAAQAVQAGWLGEIVELHGVMSKKVNQENRKELLKYSGGTMFELGCHLVDAMVWMLGKPSRTTPYIRRTERDDLADSMLAVFEYPKATATIRSIVVEPYGDRRRQFTIVGTEGTIEIRPLEPPRLDLTLAKARDGFQAGTQTVELEQLAGRYDGDMLDFAAVIRGEKQLHWNAQHDLAAHECILLASGLSIEN